MAEHLAGYGFVVVSMSANGISAGQPGEAADAARVALANRHLDAWKQLVDSGGGALSAAFPAAADLRGHVDVTRVAGIGHAEGARAVLTSGMPLTAAVALSPAEPAAETTPAGSAPLLVLAGTCDAAGAAGTAAATSAGGRVLVTVDGANRNFTNSQWSPAGGQVLAHDDVDRALQISADVRPRAGWCRHAEDDVVARQLTEKQQREVVTAYVTAFLCRQLGGDHRFDDVLSGRTLPFAHVRVTR
jgi:hypothetical protein